MNTAGREKLHQPRSISIFEKFKCQCSLRPLCAPSLIFRKVQPQLAESRIHAEKKHEIGGVWLGFICQNDLSATGRQNRPYFIPIQDKVFLGGSKFPCKHRILRRAMYTKGYTVVLPKQEGSRILHLGRSAAREVNSSETRPTASAPRSTCPGSMPYYF